MAGTPVVSLAAPTPPPEEEPATFAEAEKHESWHRAMIEEMDSIESNRTWRLVPLPPGHRSIGLKLVYKVKKNAASEVNKQKAW